ncbi:nonstructural protein [Microviridae sp.]|nr:nonstructural protein [Microviridae sp.]
MRTFEAQSPGEAIRHFEDEALNEQSPINKHPEDYALFEICTIDATTGTIQQTSGQPTCLRRAHEVIAARQALGEK